MNTAQINNLKGGTVYHSDSKDELEGFEAGATKYGDDITSHGIHESHNDDYAYMLVLEYDEELEEQYL